MKESKKKKNPVLKATKKTPITKDEQTSCITKWVIKALKKLGATPKKGKSGRYTIDGKGNDLCHKYGKLSNYIKDFPLHKVEYKEYVKINCEKERGRNQVLGKYNRKVELIGLQ